MNGKVNLTLTPEEVILLIDAAEILDPDDDGTRARRSVLRKLYQSRLTFEGHQEDADATAPKEDGPSQPANTPYRCPKCAGGDLRVLTEAWADLVMQPGNSDINTELDSDADIEHEWTSESAMVCRQCSHAGQAYEFQLDMEDSNA